MKREDAAKLVADDDDLFHAIADYVYDDPDRFDNDQELTNRMLSLLGSIDPEKPGMFNDGTLYRGQPDAEHRVVGHPRGFASWASNKQFAGYFADHPAYRIYAVDAPVRGLSWEDLTYWRMQLRDGEEWYVGGAHEYLILNPTEVNIVERKRTMKPFLAYLTEQDQEYEYKLCSVENIHHPETIGKIRLALGRYGLVSIEPDGVQTQINSAEKNSFDSYPFMPVYVCKIKMSNPVSSRNVVQSVALFTRINDEKIKLFDKDDKIVMDGAENEQHAHPVEIDDKDAQSEVGDEKAQSLVSDLMKELRSDMTAVKEGWVASHHEVGKMLGEKVRRGFYMVESQVNGFGTIRGPFRRCPDNYDYIGRLPTTSLVEKPTHGDLVEYKVEFSDADMQQDPEDAGQRDRGPSVEVEVTNQDTGKVHSAVVRATSETTARVKAVEIIAQRTGLPKEKFIATQPTEA